jgi:ATP-dependent protease HslVU (ClpYQ) peptidase subunit
LTCIAALLQDGVVYIGGDSAGVAGMSISIRRDPKVFKRGPYLIGFTSSFRMGNILAYHFDPPFHPENMDDFEFMVVRFIPSVRKCFVDNGYGSPAEGGAFIVGYRNKLYTIENDFQVAEQADNFHAVGCGATEALSSLYSTKDLIQYPRDRVLKALEAAAYLNSGVRAPFVILSDDGD